MMIKGEKKQKTYSVNYQIGSDLHFAILKHGKEVLALCKNIQKKVDLHNLEKIEDSV